jgi:hypothetical protein
MSSLVKREAVACRIRDTLSRSVFIANIKWVKYQQFLAFFIRTGVQFSWRCRLKRKLNHKLTAAYKRTDCDWLKLLSDSIMTHRGPMNRGTTTRFSDLYFCFLQNVPGPACQLPISSFSPAKSRMRCSSVIR